MTEQNAEVAVLGWSVTGLVDDEEFHGTMVKFEGWEGTLGLTNPAVYSLPETIEFESNVQALSHTDYPYTDVQWPIASKRMLDALRSAGDLGCSPVPVVMLDDTTPLADRSGEDRSPGGPEAGGYFALNEIERLDVVDWQRSDLDRHEVFPDKIAKVRRLQLLEPPGGFPPIFRLSAFPALILVSQSAREALQRTGVEGVELIDLEDFVW